MRITSKPKLKVVGYTTHFARSNSLKIAANSMIGTHGNMLIFKTKRLSIQPNKYSASCWIQMNEILQIVKTYALNSTLHPNSFSAAIIDCRITITRL